MTNVPPIIPSKLVRLRPLGPDDLPDLIRWYGDPEVNHWLHQSEYRDVSEQRVREKFGPGTGSECDLRWIIETANGKSIGLIRLDGIEPVHGKAELALSIGEKEFWSQGYGTDAISAALRWGFVELGLRRVWLITDADNARGIRCYEKCGFRREGVLRGHRLRYGEPLDMVEMGVLLEDWLKTAPS